MIDHHILDWTIIFLQYFLVLTFFRLHAHTKYSLLLRKFGSLIFRMNVVSKTQDNILLQFLNHNTFHNSLDFLKEIHKSKRWRNQEDLLSIEPSTLLISSTIKSVTYCSQIMKVMHHCIWETILWTCVVKYLSLICFSHCPVAMLTLFAEIFNRWNRPFKSGTCSIDQTCRNTEFSLFDLFLLLSNIPFSCN